VQFKPSRTSSLASSAWKPFLASGLGLVAVALLVPTHTKTQSEPRIFTEGLRIEIDRSSPAYAALEDSLMSDQVSVELASLKPQVRVEKLSTESAKPERMAAIARDIIEESRREQVRIAKALQGYRAPQVVMSATPKTVKTISLSALKISREELAQQLLMPFVKPMPQQPQVDTSWKPAPNRQRDVAGREDRRRASRQNSEGYGAMGDETGDDKPVASFLSDKTRQLTISGPLQFVNGVALTSADDRVVVYRENEGEALEVAQVSLREGSYEIFVDRPVGELIAELRSGRGEVLGRGRFDLMNLPEVVASQPSVGDIKIRIKPLPHGVYGRALDFDSPSAKKPLAQAIISFDQLPYTNTTDEKGAFEQTEIHENSSVIVRSERAGHWGTLAFSRTGVENAVDLPMFSDRSIRALTTAAGAELKMSSVIWGRITRAGKPVEGAKVDLMTTDREIKPIYFNSMAIPDPSLSATSANGLYAFVSIEAGSHAVQAMDDRGLTEPSVFPTEDRAVTVVDLDLAVDKNAAVAVYDAFKTDWPMSAEIMSIGRERGLVINRSGEGRARFTGGLAPLTLDADAGASYERTRISFTRDSRQLNFPMIPTAWLDGMAGALRLNRNAKLGTMVGFIQGRQGYKVAMDEAALTEESRVIYFDKRGEWTRKDYGVPGGGFVIFNVKPGFRSVLLELSKSTRVFATQTLVDPTVTNIINQKID